MYTQQQYVIFRNIYITRCNRDNRSKLDESHDSFALTLSCDLAAFPVVELARVSKAYHTLLRVS